MVCWFVTDGYHEVETFSGNEFQETSNMFFFLIFPEDYVILGFPYGFSHGFSKGCGFCIENIPWPDFYLPGDRIELIRSALLAIIMPRVVPLNIPELSFFMGH